MNGTRIETVKAAVSFSSSGFAEFAPPAEEDSDWLEFMALGGPADLDDLCGDLNWKNAPRNLVY